MMYQSIGPKYNGDSLLVENGFVVAAFHLQTHNQILPRAVQIHGHHHLISRDGLRGHLTPAHQHRWEGLTDVLFLSDRHYLIAVRPVSALDPHAGHQQRLLIEGLPAQLLSAKLQLLERPSVALCHKLASGSHVRFGEEETSEPHSRILV